MRRLLSSVLLIAMSFILFACGNKESGSYVPCVACGKSISFDSNYCSYCGAPQYGILDDGYSTDTEYYPENTPQPTPSQQEYSKVEKFKRYERHIGGDFKNTLTDYNVFSREIKDCCGCYFYYSACRADPKLVPATGRRDVYVRSKAGEDAKDDRAWVYVGSFDYDREGDSVIVDLSWNPIDVYAVAAIRDLTVTQCTYNASWGEEVTFYSNN